MTSEVTVFGMLTVCRQIVEGRMDGEGRIKWVGKDGLSRAHNCKQLCEQYGTVYERETIEYIVGLSV
jgi:hypothetical protein